MSNEINNPLPTPENEQITPSADVILEAPAAQEAQSGNFISRGLAIVRDGYENLTNKQKDALFIGGLALSTTILPLIGIVDGGRHVQSSEQFLEWEGLGGFAALEAATVVKFRNLLR
jgi:hypothetical protein